MEQNKVERHLIDLTISYSELGPDLWLIDDSNSGLEQIMVAYSDPTVLVRMTVMKVPEKRREDCFKMLLELNAHDIIHGAYAIDGDDIILIDTLNYETMDLGDFQTSIESLALALAQHYPLLKEFHEE